MRVRASVTPRGSGRTERGRKERKMIVGIVVEFQELKVQKFGKNNLSRVLLEAIDGTRATARYPRCSVRLPA